MSSSSSTSSSEDARSDPHFLWRFTQRLGIFALLPAVYVGTVTLADPFGFFGLPVSVVDSTWRAQVARALNPCLLKLSEYRRRPDAHILLGDSRMASLPASAVSERVGEQVANLAYGGASLQEIIDTFWFATRHTTLRSVTIGLNLDVYNDYNIARRTEAMQSMEGNPLLYFTNRNVLVGTWYALRSLGTKRVDVLDAVKADREGFWNYTLAEQQLTFSRWREPVHYRAELERVAAWARTHGVALTFVRFPPHRDVDTIIETAGLEEARDRMVRELATMGRVVDFEGRAQLNQDPERFADPIHFARGMVPELIAEVWPAPNGSRAR